MKALIVSGGQVPSRDLLDRCLAQAPELIIGADAGAGVLLRHHIPFQLALGDFDSLAQGDRDRLDRLSEVIVYPAEKDFTDTEAALREAIRRGAADIVILGATGTRLDHFLGNLGLLVQAAQQNVRVRLLDDHNELFLIQGPASIPPRRGWYLSFFPIGRDVPDFSVADVRYPLTGHHLKFAETLTVSNEFIGLPARVTFPCGLVLVSLSRDAQTAQGTP